jgi:hypothetical protein
MRRLLVIVAIAGLLWAGYWFAVSRGVEGGLRAWFAERATEGWVADYASLTTDGFPAYFETVLTDVALADPTTGVAWTAPRFAIEAQAFRPNRITARWPDRQTIASPWERIDVTAERFDASVEFVPGTSLELRAIEAHLAELALASTNRWNLRLGTGRLVAAAMDEAAHAYAVSFEASDLVPSQRLRRDLDPARLLPEEIDGMTIEAHARFDAPWDRFALERARPQITVLDLRDLRAKWGALELRAAGELSVGPDGVPDGRINVRATNWREILTLAGNAGLFPEPLLPTIERAFEILASLSGRPDTLDAPLTFRNGVVSFGPIPLGSAPRLAIR